MARPEKARVHCAHCADALVEGGTPMGVIVADSDYDNKHFHFWPSDRMGRPLPETPCGIKNANDFETRIGCHGVEITREQLLHPWTAMNLSACPECFAHVW